MPGKFIGFRKPEITFLEQIESWSGKYLIFFGIHYNKGHACWDVGASNRETGEIVRRHYSEKDNMAPEASAKTYWEELKEGMVSKPSTPEEFTLAEEIQQWLDIHEIVQGSKKPN